MTDPLPTLKRDIPLPPIPNIIPTPKPPSDEKLLLAMTPSQQRKFLNTKIDQSEIFPDEIPIKATIGKCDLMFPRTYAEFHNATPLLSAYAIEGCPAQCGEDWPIDKILLLLRRGPHRSSMRKAAIRQLRKETIEKIENGYARKVRWGDIKHNIPKKLKISPVAMIPHKSKQYRCILDLSFTLHHEGQEYTSVNDTTTRMAHPEAMAQLGQCLQRIVAHMADNFDPNHPFMFSKLDIKDGFWRMRVSDDDAWNFCYVLPSLKETTNEDDIELVVPNSLQMGWCESPPFFCSGSETARDIIERLATNPNLPSSRFVETMLQEFIANDIKPSTGITTFFEVFVDDFVGITNKIDKAHLEQISKAMINGIHSIFPPPEVTTHPGGDPVSEKKLGKGEGTWSFTKEILGWDFDGKAFTMQLPPSKCDAIIKLIKTISKLQRPSLNKYQKLAGKLQHASFGIPSGKSLFSPIQQAMRGNPKFIPLTEDLKFILQDWKYMIQFMKKHPSSVLQLILNWPDYLGHSDACKLGAGGTWTSGLKAMKPFLWQLRWPDNIQRQLVTESNPTGSLTINDLELAGLLLNWIALECQSGVPLAFHHIGAFCDNTSAVSWAQKLRTSKSKVAGRLLRLLGLRMHARQASSLLPIHIAGDNNEMADVVSRAFKDGKFFDAHKNLPSYFNLNFPLPQQASWTEFHIPGKLASRVISCLHGELSPMASLLKLPVIGGNTGFIGADMLHSFALTPSSLTHLLSNEMRLSAHSPPGSGQVCTVEEIKLKFRPSRMRSRPSTRPFSWLDNEVPCTALIKSNTTSQSSV